MISLDREQCEKCQSHFFLLIGNSCTSQDRRYQVGSEDLLRTQLPTFFTDILCVGYLR